MSRGASKTNNTTASNAYAKLDMGYSKTCVPNAQRMVRVVFQERGAPVLSPTTNLTPRLLNARPVQQTPGTQKMIQPACAIRGTSRKAGIAILYAISGSR